MKLVVQRVNHASVTIDNVLHSQIDQGFLVYLGIHSDDTLDDVIKYANKIKKLRVFEDENEKMNLDISNINGSILLVSQFTLYANSKKGNRPSFIEAARPEVAIPLYNAFIEELKKDLKVETGVFGANMKISSENDGPVTIILEDLN